MWKGLKKIMCKMTICCKSKCSLNDTDGDGIPDEVNINSSDFLEEIKQEFIEELKEIVILK
tara:strand:+ start:151 stop:333 length:183 start_codon:yes stop_codon:yes gene_type:complete